jgi:hypothetical protein
VNVAWTDLDSLAFILHIFNHFCIVSRLVSSFCEAMSGSLSVANTAALSANVAVVDAVELGRSSVYSRYNDCPRTLPWFTPAMTVRLEIHLRSELGGLLFIVNMEGIWPPKRLLLQRATRRLHTTEDSILQRRLSVCVLSPLRNLISSLIYGCVILCSFPLSLTGQCNI